MGTCEESPSLETQDEINLGIPSNGTHHDNYQEQEDQPTEEEILAQQLETVVLQGHDGEGNIEEDGEEDEEEEGQEEGKAHLYPLRPYAVDCSFYLKTGSCKFGQSCRFNHPPERSFQLVQDQEKGNEESYGTNADAAKIDCKYFCTPGGCRYGDSCRYNHSTQKPENEGPDLNFLGLPVRPLEQECAFYLRTGSCGYGANCRFHHPDPSAVKESGNRNFLANGAYVRGGNNLSRMYVGEPLQSFGVSRGITELSNGINSMNGSPYAGMNSYHQAMSPSPGWNQDQSLVNLSLSAKKTPLQNQIVNLSKKDDLSLQYDQAMQSEEFPVRPGQLDCDYFLKTGDCKYRASCRYNHPVSRSSKLRLPPLSSRGSYSKSKNSELSNSNSGNTRKTGMSSHQQQQMQNGQYPERPGQPECEFFMKTGNCKFKSACRYHHPRDRMSTSSPCALNETGLPLRPGSKICRNYELQGTCKYGQSCLFDHPDNDLPAVPVDLANGEDHRSSNLVVATDLQPPADNNAKSDWGDDWVM